MFAPYTIVASDNLEGEVINNDGIGWYPYHIFIDNLVLSNIMQQIHHTLEELFEQLGLKGDNRSIGQFVQAHQSLSGHIPLFKANFWNTAQAEFLNEAISEDADWAIVADQLSGLLRG